MPKQLKFDEEARSALLRGVNVLAEAVRRWKHIKTLIIKKA